jgi:phenylacetate-coenzyme A ligase PaaK-like adenylate-forming protein
LAHLPYQMNVSDFALELERQLEAQDLAPSPVDLADLFARTFDYSEHSRALLHVLQKYLLRKTLRHARATTNYYASPDYQDWPVRSKPEAAPQLSCWPIVRRGEVIERFHNFIAGDVSFEAECHTSGSTGPSLSIYKSSEELAFLWNYYSRLLASARASDAALPLVLFLPNLYHGVGIRLPSLGKVFVSGVTDDTLIQDALKVLLKVYGIPGHESRVSVITGLSFHIRFFTSYLLEQRFDPSEFGVRSLNLVGEYVSRPARRFLADAWQATIFDRFTLTESVGGANRCVRCDHLHLDPHVIGEVVDIDGQQPLQEGVGELVLTQLYPFVQMQPLVRYATGDLVRRGTTDCATNMTFDFLGKASNCVGWKPDGKTEWLIYSADLNDLISETPDIRLHGAFFSNVSVVRDTTVAGLPVFTVKTSEGCDRPFSIELTFELRYAPHVFKSRVSELEDRIRTRLRSCKTALARRLDEGSVQLGIRFVEPGALGDAFKIKV